MITDWPPPVRPSSIDVAARLVRYLFRHGPELDWGPDWLSKQPQLRRPKSAFDALGDLENTGDKYLFWSLIEHNFSIGYAGDLRAALREATLAADIEACEILRQLLAMKKTAREKCGGIVEHILDLTRRGRAVDVMKLAVKASSR